MTRMKIGFCGGEMSELLAKLVDYAWGMPLVILLLGGGIYLLIVSRGMALKGFFQAWKILLRSKNKEPEGKGQISHFAALTNALSATVGLGNIAGVAVAINQGGPGAIFWMWVSALIGMNTKFFECTLTLLYREEHNGTVFGGPMYVIKNAMPKKFYPLAILFTTFAAIGTLSIFNVNQLSHFMKLNFSIPLWGSGISVALLFLYIFKGGLIRLSRLSTKLVPGMCALYLICGIYILLRRIDIIPEIFLSIFTEAFQGSAVVGGVMGLTVKQILIAGMKRAAFSNEEGLVAMLGPFIDTIIVCTITALVILTNQHEISDNASGVLMTTQAFKPHFDSFAIPLMGLIIFSFSFSTLIGAANYNKKCFQFFFKKDLSKANKLFLTYYTMTILIGALWSMDDIVNLLDISGAFMAFPNMFATIYLAKKVVKELKVYREKFY